jgi:hypothetical protein
VSNTATRTSCFAILVSLTALLGCGGEPEAEPALPATQALSEPTAAPTEPPGCTFSCGVTTCVTVTQQVIEESHTEISGCTVGPSLPPIPGRERTFVDTVLVTTTTTTLQHGRNGKVFDVQTATTRQVLTSRLISDVCVPLRANG